MSLSTKDALRGAISNLYDANLCLLDAWGIDCNEEKEQIENIMRRLKSKLRKEVKNVY